MLNGLDLCSGAGGLAEALAARVRPLAYCEIDPAKQSMLVSRMWRGELPTAPIWDDIGTLRGDVLPEIDFIGAATPCTDISFAGDRAGLGGERSGLIWHVPRLAGETGAGIVFLENVWPGIRPYVPAVRAAFEELGFQCRDGVLSASDCGAWHERKRWFLFAAHPSRIAKRLAVSEKRLKAAHASIFVDTGAHSDALGVGMETIGMPVGNESEQPFSTRLLEGNNGDEYAAFLLRMDSGLPHRGHRIRAMGDAVPPIVYKTAFERLSGLK